jgi:lysine 2,3-aminomutase
MAFHFKSVLKPEAVALTDWNSWQWQIKNAIKSEQALLENLKLTESEADFFKEYSKSDFRFQITPYSLEVLKQFDAFGSLRKILIGDISEYKKPLQAQLDPLNERKNSPAPRVIHRYSDRALFLVTDFCSVYCRYCTRKHFTAKDQVFPSSSEYDQAMSYFKSKTSIREVILSGGDPLTLSDEKLIKILSDLRSIPHIEIIRIGTRIPVVLPMRVTEKLVQSLKAFHPIYMMTHFNHPDELTEESAKALGLLVDNGFPVFNQMVFLNGVNNDASLVQALNRRLVYLRVKPYYMFQCDPSEGTDHLRTSVQDSLDIQAELWGHLSGLAMANFSVDIPSGGGKAGFVPNFILDQTENEILFKGWDGVVEKYSSPPNESIKKPKVPNEYLQEWDLLRKTFR